MPATRSRSPHLAPVAKLEYELGDLIDEVWEEAARQAVLPPGPEHTALGQREADEHVRLRGAAYAMATRLFIAGKIANTPAGEALEKVIAAARKRSQDPSTENRIIAEAVIGMLEVSPGGPGTGPSQLNTAQDPP